MRRYLVRLVEVVCVLLIIASTAAMVIPKSASLARARIAGQVLEDVKRVEEAIFQFHADSGYFPAQELEGQLPEGLLWYLPANFASRRSYGRVAYEIWPVRVPVDTSTRRYVGTPEPGDGGDSSGYLARPRSSHDSVRRITDSLIRLIQSPRIPAESLARLEPWQQRDYRRLDSMRALVRGAREPLQPALNELFDLQARRDRPAPPPVFTWSHVVAVVVAPDDPRVGTAASASPTGRTMARFRVGDRFVFVVFGA